MERLSTNIPRLDDNLGGGIPKGSVFSITVPSRTQYEVLLLNFLKKKQSEIVSFYHSEEMMKKSIENVEFSTNIKQIHPIDSISGLESVLDNLSEKTEIIAIPGILPIEKSEQFREVLVDVYEEATENELIFIFLCFKENDNPNRSVTMSSSDIVITLNQSIDEDSVSFSLLPLRSRYGDISYTDISVILNDSVTIDTERRI